MQKFVSIIALSIIIASCSVAKKNNKAVNRVLGYNLVNEVIEKSNWLENHPLDTTIINSIINRDTTINVTSSDTILIDSILYIKDTVTIRLTERVKETVFDKRNFDKLKDTIASKAVTIANLKGIVFEKDNQIAKVLDENNGLKKKNSIFSWVKTLIMILCAATTVYFTVFYKRK